MALRSLLSVSLLASVACGLLACGKQAAPDSHPDAAAAAPQAPAGASIAPVPSVPSVPSLDGASQAASTGERPTLMITSTGGTVSCEGHNVDLTGQNANLVLKGACGTVAVLGQHAIVHIEHAEAVRLVGDDAQLTLAGDARTVEVLSRSSMLKAGRIDTLLVPGDNNQVQAQAIASATLHGRGNRITQQSGNAVLNDYGSDNQISTR
ncbi:hypothetical protein FHT08_003160 [Xanthomonas campestris]|uniref:DUF3060 domain-containing protein n=1 Tax=Xanthomonas TaxID=338 RepID=UPI000CEE597B|nr:MULTISPECIES: DUF3060 domain-containing protein [Xanthomonas]MBB5737276.1 hypothetical protein [Xanthomonas sp. CFBP 8152]MEB1610070.1 DUF3060 domain-containing protein [Xanthomonas campestris pv. campestris]NIJ78040.1 hypothetical protein [Xanthomonas sp. CFBP 8151]PPT80582.1 hypothetical protein XarbCFBP8152_04975 [Xanthomonas arboricola]